MSVGSTRMPGGMPSTTTPTPGPCDSPKVVTTNSRPNEDDISAAGAFRRAAHAGLRRLLRGVGAGAEGAMAVDHAFELIEVGRPDVGPGVREPGGAALPGDDVLAGVVEEQVGVQHAAVDQRRDHLPVGDGHPEPAVLLGVREVARLDVGPRAGLELGEEPGARAPQL